MSFDAKAYADVAVSGRQVAAPKIVLSGTGLDPLRGALVEQLSQSATQAEIIYRNHGFAGGSSSDALTDSIGGCVHVVGVSSTGLGSQDDRARLIQVQKLSRRATLLAVLPSSSGVGQEALGFLQGLSGAQSPIRWTLPSDINRLAGTIVAEVQAATVANERRPLRIGIVAREQQAPSREVSGLLLSGTPEPGAKVVLLPSGDMAVIEKVGLRGADGSLAITLDKEVAVRAGSVLSAAEDRPEVADQLAADIVWTGAAPLLPGRPYELRLGGQTVKAQVSQLKHKIDPQDLGATAARRLERGDVGQCNLSLNLPLIFDASDDVPSTSEFRLFDVTTGEPVGAGRILFTLRRATNIHWQSLAVDKAARSALKGQTPCCLWFTGLSGSGKSTVASLLEKRLHASGRHTYTLDGDNVRHGLNRDLGFTDADRVENVRRVAEVAKLFADAGLIVMVSFISPFRAERRMARELFPRGEFVEIFVDTPLVVCEARDPKGLYKKARAGQLKNFTGLDSPYETPENADIHLKGGEASAEVLVETVIAELSRRGIVKGA